jgi:hypothetical protein
LPWLVVLALVHWVIDFGKNGINRAYPGLVLPAYVVDQLFHLTSIIVISLAIESRTGISPFALKPGWLILAIIYLSTTFVWYISERILVSRDRAYRDRVIEYAWPRMLARTILLTAMLGVSTILFPTTVSLAALAVFPYQADSQGMRALITDIVVCLCGLLLIQLIV